MIFSRVTNWASFVYSHDRMTETLFIQANTGRDKVRLFEPSSLKDIFSKLCHTAKFFHTNVNFYPDRKLRQHQDTIIYITRILTTTVEDFTTFDAGVVAILMFVLHMFAQH